MVNFPLIHTPHRDEHLVGMLAREKLLSGYRRDETLRGQVGISKGKFKPQDMSNGVISACASYFSAGELDCEVALYENHSLSPLWRLSPGGTCSYAGLIPQIFGQFDTMNDRHLVFQKNWKFCPLCVSAQMESYGYSYWSVIHQLLGISVCSDHKTDLLSVNDGKYLDPLLLPHQISALGRCNALKEINQNWSNFIQKSFGDLCGRSIKYSDLDVCIRSRLGIPKKLCASDKMIIDDLLHDVEDRLGIAFLSLFFKHYESEVYHGNRRPNFLWTLMTHNSVKVRHPIYSLLILYYMGLSPLELLAITES